MARMGDRAPAGPPLGNSAMIGAVLLVAPSIALIVAARRPAVSGREL